MTNIAVRDGIAGPESLPVRPKDPTVPTNPWSPPLDAPDIHGLLNAVRRWEPVDWNAVYDGLDAVLNDEVSHHAAGPAERQAGAPLHEYDDAKELAQRFRGALMQLVNRGLRDEADEKHPDIAKLIERARALRSEELPGDPWQDLGLLRKLGRITLDLAERLDEVGIVRGLVEC
ncbi:DUF6415 family natural product biosynthesis protein [Streptomyces sp. MUM 2J]|uniref:DUF6415 family natural product biosynthesis protein n=1 Tax=Streptomyces sp. MUM 2J TaxID=2791987 RepID=UPI001F0505AB|nr:DUF6415 family natural product biosynthesis protein [Streptomyces sp. MUM 2J]MCH0566943.1 hypothetical protein [Streptomyces sp. MUM 2J]